MSVLRACLCAALVVAFGGCATLETADLEVNREFKRLYERELAAHGTRSFRASKARTFAALGKVLSGLGMQPNSEDVALGYMKYAAEAPLPLDHEEWREVARSDLALMQRLMARHIGLPAYLFSLDPDGLEFVIQATVFADGARAEVSLTMRAQHPVPPAPGQPRREYAPPTAVRLGLEKIWRRLESELGEPARAP